MTEGGEGGRREKTEGGEGGRRETWKQGPHPDCDWETGRTLHMYCG